MVMAALEMEEVTKMEKYSHNREYKCQVRDNVTKVSARGLKARMFR